MVLADTLVMQSNQKTFSVAVSRDMVPDARIVVYTLLSGEVLVDSLSFHVSRGASLEVSCNLQPQTPQHLLKFYVMYK